MSTSRQSNSFSIYSHFLFMKSVSATSSSHYPLTFLQEPPQTGKNPFQRNSCSPFPSPKQKDLDDIQSHFLHGWNIFLIFQAISNSLCFDSAWLLALLGLPLLWSQPPAWSGVEQKAEVSFPTDLRTHLTWITYLCQCLP